MNSRRFLFLVLMPMALIAQDARDIVPLKNWSNPLYWRATPAEREAAGAPVPQIQFSGSQVSPNALSFVAITPCRLLDTRGTATGFSSGAPYNAPIAAAGTLTIPVQTDAGNAACGTIPSIAQAYSVNITLIPVASGQVNYLSIWPAGAAQPTVATMNDKTGLILANAAIVPAGTPSGGISVYSSGPAATNLVIDMNGFFAAPSDLNGNTAIGSGALVSETTGMNNTASGVNALSANTTGSGNTASGFNALSVNTTGSGNTASGAGALGSNTTGSHNTADGGGALNSNTTGSGNTATGTAALVSNIAGMNNTATGYQALQLNTSGSANSALGQAALLNNSTGTNNTASGFLALVNNTTGSYNTASGNGALSANTTGGDNTAIGNLALGSNTTASANTALGETALLMNTIGTNNAAFGEGALINNTTGSSNIALGQGAGTNAPAGNSDSIYVGSQGTGSDASGTIQIGTEGTQTGGTFIAGISGATSSSGVEVFINTNGQLGTMTSSGRFKEEISDMGDTSSKLLQLRPVNFYYKPEYDDGSHLLQYGLVAEEVAKVYPEMVAYGEDGKPWTVRYQLLAPMLLNELQKQSEQNKQQSEQIRSLEERLAVLEALLPATAKPVR
jgi:hypothetical protein